MVLISGLLSNPTIALDSISIWYDSKNPFPLCLDIIIIVASSNFELQHLQHELFELGYAIYAGPSSSHQVGDDMPN